MARRGGLALLVLLMLVWRAQAQSDAVTAFLPFIANPLQGARAATVTVAPTATTTATPVPITLWPNGDFEQGLSVWSTNASSNDRAINRDPFDPVRPRSGVYLAVLTDSVNTIAMIAQTLAVPEATPYLSYWVWVQSADGQCGDDDAAVVLGESGVPSVEVDQFDLCVATQTTGWVNRVVDLRAYIGQTKQIAFIARSVGFLSDSQLYIDDVGWRAVPAE